MNDFKLDQEPKIKTGFRIPDGYFDNFQSELNQRLAERPKVIPLYSRTNMMMYAVAAILILALFIPALHSIDTSSTELDASAAENYLSEQSGITDDLAYLLDEEDIRNIEIANYLEDEAVEDVLAANPDFEQYILN